MNNGKTNSYSLRVLQENQCAQFVKVQSQITEVTILADTIGNTKLKQKKSRTWYPALSYGKNTWLRKKQGEEYGDLILHCEVRWLSIGQVLKRFCKKKRVVHDILEEKDELPEERALLCNES